MPLTEMSPKIVSGEGFGAGNNLTGNKSLADHVQELWDIWEIHGLILLSLSLQVFLFLAASMRRRSTSSILRTLLWLAYLSADSVAIFVLGHLAVHASRPHHQLISFWAPFVLVHLGGQETITAFSKQDNELWARHLLSLVTQVGVAGYVVAKATWPDRRLRDAMVLIFLSGCFKYAERVLCLYLASPPVLRSKYFGSFANRLFTLRTRVPPRFSQLPIRADVHSTFQHMLEGWTDGLLSSQCPSHPSDWDKKSETERIIEDIMSADTALNKEQSIVEADFISDQLYSVFLSNAGRCRAYEYVGACLVDCYHILYTKKPLRKPLGSQLCSCLIDDGYGCSCSCSHFDQIILGCLVLPYNVFRWVSTPVALLLFRAAEKGGQLHASSPDDVIVSYILLIGAVVLDACAAIISIYGKMIHSHRWSEELAQYSMIKRHIVQDTSGIMASMRQWIGRRLGGWGLGLLELTQTPVTQPIKEFILDNLLHLGVRKEWNVATSRGKLALQKWMETQGLAGSSYSGSWPGKQVLDHGLSADFPTSVLIWHIATDMCYYFGDNDDGSTDSDQTKKHKQMSREISNYIMYLVFKCDIMLTSQSQYVHDKTHNEIKRILRPLILDQQHRPGEKDAIRKLFEEEPSGIHIDDGRDQQVMRSTEESLNSPVLPRAREVAQVLTGIDNETERWGLIASVWSEMLYYIAPRCGAAFHYENLSKGGQFITHVLLLMYHLGPFLPAPGS